jgi:hypothetical protein
MNERDYEWRDTIVEGMRETLRNSVIKHDVCGRVYHMCQEEIGFCSRYGSGSSENRGILIATPLFSYESTSFGKPLPFFALG